MLSYGNKFYSIDNFIFINIFIAYKVLKNHFSSFHLKRAGTVFRDCFEFGLATSHSPKTFRISSRSHLFLHFVSHSFIFLLRIHTTCFEDDSIVWTAMISRCLLRNDVKLHTISSLSPERCKRRNSSESKQINWRSKQQHWRRDTDKR